MTRTNWKRQAEVECQAKLLLEGEVLALRREVEQLAQANERINQYTKSIGLGGNYTNLEDSVVWLLDCHRRLREFHAREQELFDQAYQKGMIAGRVCAIQNEFLSVDQLKQMTLGELAGFLMKDEGGY